MRKAETKNREENKMEQLRVGILSTGNIAATMADTVAKMKEARIYAVASRSLEKAEAFAERFQIEKALQ